jgi:hypothetical protein
VSIFEAFDTEVDCGTYFLVRRTKHLHKQSEMGLFNIVPGHQSKADLVAELLKSVLFSCGPFGSAMANPKDEKFSDKEAKARFEAALRGGLNTPPKPLKTLTKGNKKKKTQPKRG